VLGAQDPDVVLLDVNMPGINGIETCRTIRSCSDVPVIIISVRKVGKERAEAFEAGADQYITKPFDVDELIARIRAVKRRTGQIHSRVIALDQVEIDLESHEVKRDGTTSHLTKGIQAPVLPPGACGSGGASPAALTGSVGTGLWPRSGISPGICQPASEEDRAGSEGASIPADRALNWI